MFRWGEKPWRGRLALVVALLFSLLTKPLAAQSDKVLSLGKMATQIQNEILQILLEFQEALENPQTQFPIQKNGKKILLEIDRTRNFYYDYTAALHFLDDTGKVMRIFEVDWNSQKTGLFPGPEASSLRVLIKNKNGIHHLRIDYEEKRIENRRYFQKEIQFAETDKEGRHRSRGIVNIFEDIEKQITKTSSSFIDGDSGKLPSEMLQVNIEIIAPLNGYTYSYQTQGIPTEPPEGKMEYCKNPNGESVEKESGEWKNFCGPLSQTSSWQGFSFTKIPTSYKPFISE